MWFYVAAVGEVISRHTDKKNPVTAPQNTDGRRFQTPNSLSLGTAGVLLGNFAFWPPDLRGCYVP